MPARSNDFQEMVSLLTHVLGSNDALSVNESSMVHDKVLNCDREVDVCAEGLVAGTKVVVGVECRAWIHPQTVEWVEQMKGKHEHLETSTLVLVSSSGFTRNAKILADFWGIKAITPGDITPDFVGRIVGNIDSVRYRQVEFSDVRQMTLWVLMDQGVVPIGVPEHAILALTDGEPIGETQELAELIKQRAHPDADVMVGASGSEDGFVVQFGDRTSREPFMRIGGQAICLLMIEEDGQQIPVPIIAGEILGAASVLTSDISLTHRTYDSVPFSNGIATSDGLRVHLVVTEREPGQARGAVRVTRTKLG